MLKRLYAGALGAVGFLTVLPASSNPGPSALWWFPVVGGVIGGLVGMGWWGALQVWPPLVAAVIAVLLDVLITGAIHFDGLLDSADGLLAPVGKGEEARQKRLGILKDVSVGSFGFVAGAVVILTMVAAITALGESSLSRSPVVLIGIKGIARFQLPGVHVGASTPVRDVLCFVGLWAASRALVGLAMQLLPYARGQGGVASMFLANRRSLALVSGEAILGLAIAGSALALWRVPLGLVALLVALVAGWALLLLGKLRLGGYTGDVLGACCVLVQLAGLLVAAGRW
jgi:adenosylcobinamide-GDP ribazoletransferase